MNRKYQNNKLTYHEHGIKPGGFTFIGCLRFKRKKGVGVSITIGVSDLVKGMLPLNVLEAKLQQAFETLEHHILMNKKEVIKMLR